MTKYPALHDYVDQSDDNKPSRSNFIRPSPQLPALLRCNSARSRTGGACGRKQRGSINAHCLISFPLFAPWPGRSYGGAKQAQQMVEGNGGAAEPVNQPHRHYVLHVRYIKTPPAQNPLTPGGSVQALQPPGGGIIGVCYYFARHQALGWLAPKATFKGSFSTCAGRSSPDSDCLRVLPALSRPTRTYGLQFENLISESEF